MINSKTKNKEVVKRLFPKLMRIKDECVHTYGTFIVLFTSSSAGMVVYTENETRPMGFYINDWSIKQFEDFEGEVVLEND